MNWCPGTQVSGIETAGAQAARSAIRRNNKTEHSSAARQH